MTIPQIRPRPLIEEIGQTVIKGAKLGSCSESDTVDSLCLALYTTVRKGEVLSLVDRFHALNCAGKIQRIRQEKNLKTRASLLETVEQVCRCFSIRELSNLGIESSKCKQTSYGYELSSEKLHDEFKKHGIIFSTRKTFEELIQDLSQVTIQGKNLRTFLESKEINLDSIVEALQELALQSDLSSFSEKSVVLAFLKRLQAFETSNPGDPRIEDSSIRKQKYEEINCWCRFVSSEELTRWGISHRVSAEKFYKISNSVWQEVVLNKMQKNAQKAVLEHLQEALETDRKLFFTLETFTAAANASSSIDLDSVKIFAAEDRGSRDYMQDAHFCVKINEGILAGVFDGHGVKGDAVAQMARDIFLEKFPEVLREYNNDVYTAFLLVTEEVHQRILSRSDLDQEGSTAVVSFVDTSGLVYTATIGNCETFLYRMDGKNTRCLPCSVIRNWKSKKDEKVPMILGQAQRRSLGDWECAKILGDSVITYKPKITKQQIKLGDTLLLTSDSIVKSMRQQQIIQCVTCDNPAEDIIIAAKNARCELGKKAHNMTAVVIKF